MSLGQNLKKGIVIILFSNCINMFINSILNFIQPKFLSIETYASIKTFTLYMTFSGFFHLGYADGMFLRYGGSKLDTIELNNNISTFRSFQCIISFFVFIIAMILEDSIMKIFAIFILPYNIVMYYRLLFQATGEFSIYGKILSASSLILFLLNIILIFIFKTNLYYIYLFLYVIVYLIICIVLERYFTLNKNLILRFFYFSIYELLTSIKSGFLIMLGNLSSIMLTSTDRWFVKFLFNTFIFAEYSFAASVENILNLVITPFSVTLYNYFCQQLNIESIIKIRDYICIIATFAVSSAFLIKFIINLWLPYFEGAINIIFYLFAAQMLLIIIKCFYINLFKAYKKQRQYFIKLVITITSNVIFNALFVSIYYTKEAIAIGTFVSAIVYFFLCQFSFSEIKFSLKHYFYIATEVIIFILLGRLNLVIIGFISYISVSIILDLIFFKNEFISFLYDIYKFIK